MVSPVTAAQKTKKQSAESEEKTKRKQAEVAKKGQDERQFRKKWNN